MCTVTYIKTKFGFLLTSSRDEQAVRPTLAPKKYSTNGIDLVYPKDELAGGTWIAANNSGRYACLLNGAYKKHLRQFNYAKSRGLLLLESFSYSSINSFVNSVNLNNIEPFTMLMLDASKNLLPEFHELRWDGEKKYSKIINQDVSHIWSSATLYSSEIQQQREEVFSNWLAVNKEIDKRSIFNFHTTKHGLGNENDFVMQRKNNLMTLSISQISTNKAEVQFDYVDLITSSVTNTVLNINRKLYA